MKIIDLLNKIANGEELPKKVKYKYKEYICYDCHYDLTKYETLPTQYEYSKDLILDNMHLNLNDEIEIIEEPKKIEKLDVKHIYYADYTKVLCEKVDEIIDYINKG